MPKIIEEAVAMMKGQSLKHEGDSRKDSVKNTVIFEVVQCVYGKLKM